MIYFTFLHPRMTEEHLGILPYWFNEEDPRPAAEQIDANYSHGGGWHGTNRNYEMDTATGSYKYPGDPKQHPVAKAQFRDETLYFYEHEMLAIVQADGSFEVGRVN